MHIPLKQQHLYGLLFFLAFEVVVYSVLRLLLAGMGQQNQFEPANSIVPNWVKAITFILLYVLCLLAALMVASNLMPARHRKQLLPWVYLALAGMVVMLFFIF